MAIRAGLGASIGVKKETTFGAFATPTQFFPFDTESLSRQQNYSDASGGLRGGRAAPLVSLHKQTTRSASGDIAMKVQTKGFGSFLNLLHGNTVTPEKQGASAAYKQIHKLGENGPEGKSLTIQEGVPDTETGTIRPYSYVGSKITSLGLSVAEGGELDATISVNARDEVPGEAFATPSYGAGIEPFLFTKAEVKVAEDAMGITSSFNMTLPVPLNTTRFGLIKSSLAAEPILNGQFAPTGAFTMEFANMTQYNHFVNNDEVKIVFTCEGETIAEAYKSLFKVTLPACHFTGTSPTVSGPDLIQASFPFSVFDNGTEAPATIEYVSTDPAIV